MRFWYSVNGKKFFRPNITSYMQSSSTFYGVLTDGTDFKATDGTTGAYIQSAGSQNSSVNAANAMQNTLYPYYIVPFQNHTSTASEDVTRIFLCLDNTTFDDTKYDKSGMLALDSYSISIARSYPGSTVLTVTNSGADAITFNALEFTSGNSVFYLSSDNTTRGIAKKFLIYALILDETVTIPAGGTYSITYTT